MTISLFVCTSECNTKNAFDMRKPKSVQSSLFVQFIASTLQTQKRKKSWRETDKVRRHVTRRTVGDFKLKTSINIFKISLIFVLFHFVFSLFSLLSLSSSSCIAHLVSFFPPFSLFHHTETCYFAYLFKFVDVC